MATIASGAIDTAALLAGVTTDADGAGVLFVGTVRAENEGRPVRAVTYEAYVAMAEKELAHIVEEVRARTGVERIAAVHRTGTLRVGEASVAVAAASPHRAEAFDAARAVIEAIKVRLPVWKREHYADGAEQWLEGAIPPGAGGGA
ncbi:MAG TPA: molybdenum cofactor biosynthesis protein MoaE [Longimicrobiales bacterium]